MGRDQLLNPPASPKGAKAAYLGIAGILLEPSKPEFPFIGAIRLNESDKWTAETTVGIMNRLAQLSNIPHSIFSQQHFNNVADYFEGLARQHFHHLELQRNDAVIDEVDCRKKYIARCLFRKLSRDISKEQCNGTSKLYCK